MRRGLDGEGKLFCANHLHDLRDSLHEITRLTGGGLRDPVIVHNRRRSERKTEGNGVVGYRKAGGGHRCSAVVLDLGSGR